MRLTEKDGKHYISIVESKCFDEDQQCIDKLGQLEDIEETIKIPIIILWKAINEGIYFRDGDHYYVWIDMIEQDTEGDYYFDTVKGAYYFKDYGVTWALTKEELE